MKTVLCLVAHKVKVVKQQKKNRYIKVFPGFITLFIVCLVWFEASVTWNRLKCAETFAKFLEKLNWLVILFYRYFRYNFSFGFIRIVLFALIWFQFIRYGKNSCFDFGIYFLDVVHQVAEPLRIHHQFQISSEEEVWDSQVEEFVWQSQIIETRDCAHWEDILQNKQIAWNSRQVTLSRTAIADSQFSVRKIQSAWLYI